MQEEITTPEAMEDAISALFDYRVKEGLEHREGLDSILGYSPKCSGDNDRKAKREKNLIGFIKRKLRNKQTSKQMAMADLIVAVQDYIEGNQRVPNCHFDIDDE